MHSTDLAPVLSATSNRVSVWIISLFPTCISCQPALQPTSRNQSWTRHSHREPLAALLFGQILTLFAKRSPRLCLKKQPCATSCPNYLQLTSNHGPVSHLFSPAKGFEAPALNGTARCATPCWSRWRANCRRCAAIAAGGWRLAAGCRLCQRPCGHPRRGHGRLGTQSGSHSNLPVIRDSQQQARFSSLYGSLALRTKG